MNFNVLSNAQGYLRTMGRGGEGEGTGKIDRSVCENLCVAEFKMVIVCFVNISHVKVFIDICLR